MPEMLSEQSVLAYRNKATAYAVAFVALAYPKWTSPSLRKKLTLRPNTTTVLPLHIFHSARPALPALAVPIEGRLNS